MQSISILIFTIQYHFYSIHFSFYFIHVSYAPTSRTHFAAPLVRIQSATGAPSSIHRLLDGPLDDRLVCRYFRPLHRLCSTVPRPHTAQFICIGRRTARRRNVLFEELRQIFVLHQFGANRITVHTT